MEAWITSPVVHFELPDLADLPLAELCSPTSQALFSHSVLPDKQSLGTSSSLQPT